MDKKTLLVIGAHLDDCEIGAGGVILKAIARGHRVVLLNVASDYSTWRVTQGREKSIRERLLAHAEGMGAEKRFLDFGYQQVACDVETMRRVAEVVVDVGPDITFMHDANERERAPSDHSTVGIVAEKAVRCADTILGGLITRYGKEMYAYEVYPQRDFRPDVFIDIADVIEPLAECINFFGDIYGESPHAASAGRIESTVKLHATEQELKLGHYAALKLCAAQFRGYHCGLRYAEAFRALDPAPLGRRLLNALI